MNTLEQAVKPKFAWSYSRLKNFETCPRRHAEVDLLKNWQEEPSEHLSFGDAVHTAMATALRTNKPLPLAYRQYQKWIDRVNRTKGEMLVESECRWAITRDFEPTAWMSDDVWLRSVADVIKIDTEAPATALVVDWKTGKSRNVDPIQLTLTALMVFIQFAEVKRVRADFVWLQEDSHTTQVIDRHETADHWADMMPRVERMRKMVESGTFPPTPNRLCKAWCPVRSCEYWGK
jgi:hypothetical protein